MDLNKYTDQLRANLVAAAALGDEKTQATAAALAAATENSARLVLLAALSDLAGEVNATLTDRTVHVSVNGADAHVDVRKTPGEDEDRQPSFEEMTGDISRVTLRLVEKLKASAEDAAAQSGQSLNSWLGSAVQNALRDQMKRGGPGRCDTP
ncbi:hypothetical protein [Nocardia huaxiensis]|uniref:Toxin-antitoxin system HicB family antitoxin n=1 Tax=Nocardia huaxiensis TaxID=2755382 RepID=A0A7D6ZGD1_9NOCA|nr:hypothetical protein [Nocardia huaxiensis]QLY29667.1 hypothetical protein H0264_31230 [Nocardia huaxiensis]UFS96759.1 hypothetical protein LPY97_02150 [Nocardia huaxiensis]